MSPHATASANIRLTAPLILQHTTIATSMPSHLLVSHVADASAAEQHGRSKLCSAQLGIICILVVIYSIVAMTRPLGSCRSVVCCSNLRSCLIEQKASYMECTRAGTKQGPQ
ncbi:hypothetical protein BDR05DRAFT_969642 [Suillus weaverae]|nr:hypothetical protein BDR05DRAFT_969642 [Suillus weaverae]